MTMLNRRRFIQLGGLGTGLKLGAPEVAATQTLPTVKTGDVIKAADLNVLAQAIDARWEASGTNVVHRQGNVGIGLASPNIPSQKLHIADGNVLLEGGGETAFLFKRDFSTPGDPSHGRPASTNPIFHFARIIKAGDGDPEFRVLYSDDDNAPYSVFEFDKKGIVASVRFEAGSHVEGFVVPLNERTSGISKEPLFRLNSSPSMQLEMGQGGTTVTDVAVRRAGTATLSFLTGSVTGADGERMRINADGNVGIGITSPADKLHVAGNVRAANFIAGNTQLNVPNYVFDSDYPLMPLSDLGSYIARERHLPNMPSAADVTREGLNLNEFQMKLFEKIEELTLHVLEQQKTIEAQQVRIDALAARLKR